MPIFLALRPAVGEVLVSGTMVEAAWGAAPILLAEAAHQ